MHTQKFVTLISPLKRHEPAVPKPFRTAKNMQWINNSIMAQNAVAKGLPGVKHRLNEADQGEFHYVYSPYATPVMRITPEDVVEV